MAEIAMITLQRKIMIMRDGGMTEGWGDEDPPLPWSRLGRSRGERGNNWHIVSRDGAIQQRTIGWSNAVYIENQEVILGSLS